MLQALKKRKENIAEYILYLYQVEDLIRAFDLDIELINEKLIPVYRTDKVTSDKISDWYKNLILMMEKEGKNEKGHLQFLSNLIADLNEFHIKLMETEVVKNYNSVFNEVSGLLAELHQKNQNAESVVQVGLDGVYGYLILKIHKRKISSATEDAIKRMSYWLGFLSNLYKDFENGKLEF
jgi:hypothetical protein